MSISRTGIKAVLAKETREGVGATVRRSITPQLAAQMKSLSPFLMLDDAVVGPGAGFPDHPHRGQATISYLLRGSFRHEDFEGHKGTIEEGGVQWMIAGRGIMHSETPVNGPGLPIPHGLQLWIDLPKEHKMVKPSYQEMSASEIPSYISADGNVTVKIISGETEGVKGKINHLGGCYYYDVRLKNPTATHFQPLPKGWTGLIYTLEGSLTLTGSEKEISPHHTIVLSDENNEDGVLMSTSSHWRGILLAGEKLDQPVVQYGPFVLTSERDARQALSDFQNARNGFEKARNWKSENGEAFR